MAVNLSPIGGVAGQFFDNNGNPLSGGKIYTYSAGTTTPQTTYTSAGGGTPHSNPIILDAAGRVPGGEIWLTDGLQYKFVIQTSTNVLIGTYDNVIGINSNFINYTNEQEIQTATAGQTVFTLTTMQYQPGTNSLSVFVDGVNQYGPGSQYAYQETSSTVVTFASGLHVGAEVKFTTSSINASSYGDAEQISYNPPFTGGVATNVEVKLAQTISISDFGASPLASAAANTVAIQAAINACPEGGTVIIDNGVYQINDALIINKAMTLAGLGPGKFIDTLGGSIIKQTDATKNVITFRATASGYAFGAYGLLNVNLRDFAIEGPSNGSRAVRGIGCDTTVNAGDYHIRECTFTNLQVRYCQTGIEFVGICYLNDFYGGVFSQCDNGFVLARGAASDAGGQTRFFGTTFNLLSGDSGIACIRWNTDTTSGDLSLFGCTLADATYGIVSNEDATLYVSGCSFESIKNTSGAGAGIYIEIKQSNPATDSAKTIIGNKFLDNDASVWLDKTTSAGSTNSWAWPMLIDGNTLVDVTALKITVQSGEPPLSAQNFVLGAANSGLDNGGFLSPSQISANFAGRDMRKQTIARRTTFGPTAIGTLQLPAGMVVTSARMYLTANAASFTDLFGGDGVNNYRYYSAINGQTAPLNTWNTWTPTVPQTIVSSGLMQQVILSGTAGLLGATGVFEIEGYIP